MFKRYELQESEVIQGTLLTPIQVKVIENRLSDLGEELIKVSYSRSDPDFFNKIAQCQGQIAELRSMLENSEFCYNVLNPREDSSQ